MAEATRLWALRNPVDGVIVYAVKLDWPLEITLVKVYRLPAKQDPAFVQLHDLVTETGSEAIEAQFRRIGFVDLP